MSSQLTVAVYYHDQRESELPSKIVTRIEARVLKLAGKGFFISHGTAFRLQEKQPHRGFAVAARLYEFDHVSTISLAEILANVGITSNDPGDLEAAPLRHQIARAQEKVAHYRFIFDDRATLARR